MPNYGWRRQSKFMFDSDRRFEFRKIRDIRVRDIEIRLYFVSRVAFLTWLSHFLFNALLPRLISVLRHLPRECRYLSKSHDHPLLSTVYFILVCQTIFGDIYSLLFPDETYMICVNVFM